MKRFFILLIILFASKFSWAQVPFTQTTLIQNLNFPISFDFAPNDGRIFFTLKGGVIAVYNSAGVFQNNFYNLTDSVVTGSERGLLGMAFDPEYKTNKYIYFYYNHRWPNTGSGNQTIRVIRFTDNSSVGTNPTVILDIPVSNSIPGNHVGGNIHFRPSDKNNLYIAIGELATTSNAQTLVNPFGKIIRINKNGAIPPSNPFYDDGNPNTGNDDRIWEYGHRNPFDFTFSTTNDSLYISENGASTQDEVNVGHRGSNYGWPNCEGALQSGSANPCTNPAYTNPIMTWQPTQAITGILFYNGCMFPEYKNHLLVGDYNNGNLYDITLTNPPAYNTASGKVTVGDITSGGLTSLRQGADGSIYALNGGYTSTGKLYKLTRPINSSIVAGGDVVFCQGGQVTLTASPSGYDYQWRKDGVVIPGASTLTYNAKESGVYRVNICNNLSNTIKAIVRANPRPVITPQSSTAICSGDSVKLQANINAVLLYEWRKDGKVIPGATKNAYTAKAAGTYKVKETHSQTGCNKLSAGKTVTIVCRNGEDGFETVGVYPNPFNNQFTLQLNSAKTYDIAVMDMQGRQLLNLANIKGSIQLGESLSAGLYILHLLDESGNQQQFKLVKTE